MLQPIAAGSLICWLLLLSLAGCSGTPSAKRDSEVPADGQYIPYTAPDERGDAIPDFSRVGYKWGDEEIPDPPVVATLEAPADGSDATALIQRALDEAPSPGAVLLRSGTYRISGTLHLRRSGIALRGEEREGCRLIATGTVQRSLIVVGGEPVRRLAPAAAITDDYTPVGQMYVTVDAPQRFRVGDEVAIYRPATAQWLSDLQMDRIPPRADGGRLAQWSVSDYGLYWERTVVRISGRRIYLDNPVVMALDVRYGGGQLMRCACDRISTCGVERMTMISEYASETDEAHGWTAVQIRAAEHCWVREITSRHFGFGLADMASGSKHITVERCVCLAPKSRITGSRRYSFYLSGGALCLVRDCATDDARHGFSSSARVGGPNVFLRCTSTHAHDDCGPHQRWATGILYDNVTTDYLLRVQDRSNMGSGQGWAGATHVFWNCEAQRIVCQSPWVSAKNYAIGCIGTKEEGSFKGRPDGVWASFGEHVEPRSLYERQLDDRRARRERAAPPSCY